MEMALAMGLAMALVMALAMALAIAHGANPHAKYIKLGC